jgi:hypothetical protein
MTLTILPEILFPQLYLLKKSNLVLLGKLVECRIQNRHKSTEFENNLLKKFLLDLFAVKEILFCDGCLR